MTTIVPEHVGNKVLNPESKISSEHFVRSVELGVSSVPDHIWDTPILVFRDAVSTLFTRNAVISFSDQLNLI